jgi:serine/threonine protein phosphatase PrpC
MITASGVTNPGRVRPINEDTFICDIDNGLFIVADGMGGHHAGEIASTLAVEAIRTFLTRTRDGQEMTWPYGIDPNLSFDGNWVMTAIKLANKRVFKAGESREDYSGMGTTVVVALATGGQLVFAGVGDSRIYSFAGGAIEQLTKDDSWVSMMLGNDNLDPRVLSKHPMKHVLTNVIGARDQIEFKVMERPLEKEETLLLSTDGLHESLEPSVLEEILGSGGTPEAIADELVQAALERGSSDNVTALVVRHQA